MNLSILYRGPLLSCNYGCEYCPFAKRQQTAAELNVDSNALARFVQWIADHPEHTFSLLFTPWGEALIHPWYQTGLSQLSHLPNVKKVAIQTNLSCNLDWIKQANPTTLALWATFHPEWSNADRFLEKCHTLIRHNIHFSVGMVGFAKFKQAMSAMRDRLPANIYLWINAVKKELPNLSAADRQFFQSIDPLYELNTQHYPSLGKACQAGETIFSVDGEGTMRRCHFIKGAIGNLYEPHFEKALSHRPCTNETCRCYIGYIHMDELALSQVY
ncbi:MAG: STM4011 family radical SAM protein, partial [Cyanobacteria bacterium J06555_13]